MDAKIDNIYCDIIKFIKNKPKLNIKFNIIPLNIVYLEQIINYELLYDY